MKVTDKWLERWEPCEYAVNFVKEKTKSRCEFEILNILIDNEWLVDANWFIVRRMTYKQYVKYACYAAKQVLPTFEKKYPYEKRPRKAIAAALKCAKNPSKENKTAAAHAAYAADAYAYADADAYADAAAYAAAHAAYAAYAADAADAAAHAAYAAYAADAADAIKEMRLKILKYGIKLLKEKGVNK